MKHSKALSFLSLLFAVVAAVITLGLMIYAGHGWKQGAGWWLSFLAFGAWAVAPYAALSWLSFRMRKTIGQTVVFLVAVLVIMSFGMVILYDGFFVHIDAQNALLFVVVPFYQWIGVALALGIGYWVGNRRAVG